ncbi:class F sortase [Modestobacter sp. VKM Ac-2983]|uniref:class F sortase n=1 Tax=Modestobacter sp. VKM Ac-2983 TaxID=3004137 RepID=UPI0022AB6A2A|nr:class F sortase [Modestobacter sp. VKM Ac-2983]MCZ2804557.1 class F sortase [Modestobacter sp. VKM Ac-2983]
MTAPGRRRSWSTRALLAVVLTVLAVTTSGCAGSAPGAAPAPTSTVAPDTVAPAAALPAVLAASVPVRVQIPAIGVDSELMDLGLQPDGTLEVPPSGFPAGWFTDAPTPGERGPAVIAGHVDWAGSPGVFAELGDMVVGDEIAVQREDGSTALFRVTEVGQYPKDEFPTAAVYSDLDHAGLRLITCSGEFDPAAHSYLDNTVVFADLVPPA